MHKDGSPEYNRYLSEPDLSQENRCLAQSVARVEGVLEEKQCREERAMQARIDPRPREHGNYQETIQKTEAGSSITKLSQDVTTIMQISGEGSSYSPHGLGFGTLRSSATLASVYYLEATHGSSTGVLVSKALELHPKAADTVSTTANSVLLTEGQFITAAVVGGVQSVRPKNNKKK
jgi:hypothetical protein